MQPGVCFAKETNLLTGERLVFLVETNVYKRQKRFVLQAKLTFWRFPSFGLKAVERKKQRFSSQNQRFPCEKVSFGVRNKPFSETLAQNKLCWS